MNRNIVTAILLSIITCGIYGWIWLVNLDSEINEMAGTPEEKKGWLGIILTYITCGIYAWFWMYKLGEKVEIVKANAGQPAGSSPVVFILISILLSALGVFCVNPCLIQNTINSVVPAAE